MQQTAPTRRRRTASLLMTGWLMLSLCLISSCSNLQQPVEIDLPSYSSELAVECYLEPGKRYRLLLTQSVPYLDGNIVPEIVTDALVIIAHDSIQDTLLFDPTDFLDPQVAENWFEGNKKVYNFRSKSSARVPADYDTEFNLFIRDAEGREITGTTRLLEPVYHDTLEYEFNATGELFLVRGRWQDDPDADNYYRWTQHRLKRNGKLGYKFNFVLDDRVGNGEEFIVSSFYDYEVPDCLVATLYHIDQPLADYLNTIDDAEDSNGNPFAQPGSIISNVQGGIGIFSGLTYTRDTIWAH